MPVTLNSTTISTADATTGWTADTNNAPNSGPSTGGVLQKEGSGTVEFDLGNTATGGIKSPTVTAFDVRTQEVGVWFLNPKVDENGVELMNNGDSALRLRLYSGTNYADYYQGNNKLTDGFYPGGWMFLRASGAAGSEDANGGTWTNTQAAAVDSASIIVTSVVDNTNKNATEYAVDIIKYYDKIVVTGYNGGTTPWTLQDIYDASETNAWGVVEKAEGFYRFYCGLEFGDGTNAGAFEATNEYIYLDHSSSDHEYNVVVKNNFTVTLGEKNTQTQDTYAQNGCQLVATEDALFQLSSPAKCAPSLTVESGGILELYDTKVQGFGTINLGSGGSSAIELINTDLYDNDEVEFRSTGLTADNIRIHHLSTDKGDLGAIYNVPSSMTRINVFNCTDALNFQETMSVTKYNAGDTTYDVVVLEGKTVTLINSVFNETKIKRVT